MNKLSELYKAYRDELVHKVTWLRLEELQELTLTVLVASALVAIAVTITDLAFNRILSFIYSLFGS